MFFILPNILWIKHKSDLMIMKLGPVGTADQKRLPKI